MTIVPQIDTYPGLVTFGQTAWGKLGLVAAFGGALKLNGVAEWIELTAIVAVITFLPQYRRGLVSVATLYWLAMHHSWLNRELVARIASMERQSVGWPLRLETGLTVIAVLGIGAALFHLVRTQPFAPISRRPVLVLVTVYFAILAAAGLLPLHGRTRVLTWILISVLTPYLWYFGYALADASSKTPDSFGKQFGFFHPFWMIRFQSFTPIGKGAAYLRKVEAKTAKELSVVQLKAVKLLLWIFIIDCFRRVFISITHGGELSLLNGLATLKNPPSLGLPTVADSLRQTAAGVSVPIHLAWGSVGANFILAVVTLYIQGNLAVACCRMAGFYALRNTYRPLQAVTIADFWNRYYYYFKELLVEFFFFPTYRRYFKKYRRLRLFAATLAAATLGNSLYHFARDYQYIAEKGFWSAARDFQVLAFYMLMIGIGIGISQVRSHPIPGTMRFHRRVRAMAGVFLFFALMQTFVVEYRAYPLSVHVTFVLNMFGLLR